MYQSISIIYLFYQSTSCLPIYLCLLISYMQISKHNQMFTSGPLGVRLFTASPTPQNTVDPFILVPWV